MADQIPISGLTAVTVPAGTDTFPVVQGGVTKKETVAQALAGGGGVIGPASATDRAIVLFNGTTGKLIQNSPVTMDSSGDLTFPSGANITMPGASFINSNSFNGNAVQFKGSSGSNLIGLQSGQAQALIMTDGSAPNGYFTVNTSAQTFTFNVPVTITESSSGNFFATLSNTGTGDAAFSISSNNNTYTQYNLISSTTWVSGIDASSNASFRISETAFGSTDWILLDSLNNRAQFYFPVYTTQVQLTGDASAHVGINWLGTTGQNIMQVPNNLTEAVKFLDVAGNDYYAINSSTARPKNSFNIEIQSNQPFFENNNVFAAGVPYNTTAALSASSSGTTVTGSGTTFPAGCANGVIYWPSTQQYARIVTRSSGTSLTIDTSITQALAPFVIYYNGITYNSQSNVFALSPATTMTFGDGSTLAFSGNHAATFTLTGTTGVTFPTSGTLATTSQIPTGAALTESNDTNVTLTLGGSASTALVNAASITAGWTGTLSGTRGGTGVNNGSSTITIGGNVTYSGAFNFTGALTNTTSVTFPTSGTLATTGQLPTPAALTVGNDTNVTLTLGGTPATALLQAASVTAGWTGQLAVGRGGTGISSFGTGVATALGQNVTGSGGIVLATSPSLTTPTLGAASATSLNFGASSTNGIIGVTTNNNAAAGVVGEYISSNVPSGSAISISSGAFNNVTSISLTAGDWDVSGCVVIQPTTSTISNMAAWFNTVSGTQPSPPNGGGNFQLAGVAITDRCTLGIPTTRYSLSATTTVYLGVYAAFTGGSNTAYGFIGARRFR